MLLFNIPNIDNNTIFSPIQASSDIKSTKANSVVYFTLKDNYELVKYCNKNNIKFALVIENIREAVFSNALHASFIFTNKALSANVQKIVENYMFDAKNILVLENDDDIDFAITHEIDGVIYLC